MGLASRLVLFSQKRKILMASSSYSVFFIIVEGEDWDVSYFKL